MFELVQDVIICDVLKNYFKIYSSFGTKKKNTEILSFNACKNPPILATFTFINRYLKN